MLPLEQIHKIQASGEASPLSCLSFRPEHKILVLAPHPDDFDEVAVTLRYFFKLGHPILLLVLTGASSGVLDSFVTPPTKSRKEAVREEEQLMALDFFGFPSSNVKFLRLEEDAAGELIVDQGCRHIVGELFRKFGPDIVSLPYGKDTNLSHRETFELFKELASNAQKPVLGLCHRGPKTTEINIQAFCPFDEATARWKGEMLRFHQSQHTRNLQTRSCGIDDRILQLNQEVARGLGIKDPYAEEFQLVLINEAKHTT